MCSAACSSGKLEQHVNPLLFDGIPEQKRVVRANQNLQLAQLVDRWWYRTKHELRIGGWQGGVKLV